MTYQQLLDSGIKKAYQYKKETEAVKFLLLEMSNLSSAEFYANFQSEVTSDFIDKFNDALDKYLIDSIPIQHILGYSYFYGRKFKINSNAFIPRNETEELVENILLTYDEYFDNEKIKCLDLGTGSGCISITLAKEEPNLKVTATDLSEEALMVAKENAKNLEADVTFLISNWFNNITGKFDIIVSNPPYIPENEVLDDIVKKDPSIALFGGADGTIFYEEILKNIKPHLNEKALIAFEHGYNQHEKIKEYALKYLDNPIIKVILDYCGKKRMTLIGIGGILS